MTMTPALPILPGRPGRVAGFALLLFLPNLWWVGPYLLPAVQMSAARAESTGPELRIIAFNLFYRNHQHQQVLDWLIERDADVLVLSGLTPAWRQALMPLEAAYPFHVLQAQPGSQGLGRYSRVPFTASELTDLGVPLSNKVRATLLPAGEPLAVPLVAPISPARARARNGQLERIGRMFEGKDHVLVSPEPGVTRLATGPRLGSERLPVEITVTLPPGYGHQGET